MDRLPSTDVTFENGGWRSYRAEGAAGGNHAGDLPLFRPEALDQQKHQLYGEIVLLRPVALLLFLWLALFFTAAITSFLIFGRYTEKAHISGVLLPDRGLIKLYSPIGGILIASHVHEGQEVRKGDVLFELSSDKSSLALGSTQTEIHRELVSRRQSLMQERADALKLGIQQELFLKDRLGKLKEERRRVVLETDTSQRKLVLADGMVDKYRQLRSANLISALQLEEKEGEPLEQQKALQELQRSQLALEREYKEVESQLQRIPLQTETQVAPLDRSIAEIEGQLSENEASRAAVVRAPANGIISAIGAKTGITVQPSSPLATLVPAEAKLEAHLYAPSRAIGFVKPGAKVSLRYQAYPSEKFGHHFGVVSQVSRVALNPAEYAFRTGGTIDEPMYEITVLLSSESIMLYRQPQRLQAGMAVDADILLQRRRLIEWIFEPLLRLRGRLTE
jgi:membrane fusion protein